MGRVKINGVEYEGDHISMENGRIIVDGNVIHSGDKRDVIQVLVEGNVGTLIAGDVTINGNVLGRVDANTVTCELIGGKVDANTVTCDTIGGDVDANTVRCEYVNGDVDANNYSK